ncbi:MAG: hypothetical protein MHM6MM_005990 [Cercozoa sp. M6MM]
MDAQVTPSWQMPAANLSAALSMIHCEPKRRRGRAIRITDASKKAKKERKNEREKQRRVEIAAGFQRLADLLGMKDDIGDEGTRVGRPDKTSVLQCACETVIHLRQQVGMLQQQLTAISAAAPSPEPECPATADVRTRRSARLAARDGLTVSVTGSLCNDNDDETNTNTSQNTAATAAPFVALPTAPAKTRAEAGTATLSAATGGSTGETPRCTLSLSSREYSAIFDMSPLPDHMQLGLEEARISLTSIGGGSRRSIDYGLNEPNDMHAMRDSLEELSPIPLATGLQPPLPPANMVHFEGESYPRPPLFQRHA